MSKATEKVKDELFNIFSALADSLDEMTDEEILEEAKESGIDVEATANRTRAVLLDALEGWRKQNEQGD